MSHNCLQHVACEEDCVPCEEAQSQGWLSGESVFQVGGSERLSVVLKSQDGALEDVSSGASVVSLPFLALSRNPALRH